MANICNSLEKLPPPSFVTTATSLENRKVIIQTWSKFVVKSKYETLKELLTSEISLLSGYIERKGTQLRLEKALMLTQQIQKVALRWKANDFYTQFEQFQSSVGDFDKRSGYLRQSKSNVSRERLPSTQWVSWVMYLALRDSALLAKICIECERTVKFWFGLIASGHHWGDSLVICGILSRIWHVSGKLTEDLVKIFYPCLYQVSTLVTPNNAPKWPNEEFQPPMDLVDWIQNSLQLPWTPIQPKNFIPPSRLKFKKGSTLSFLSNFFDSSQQELQPDLDESQLFDPEENVSPQPVESIVEDFGITLDERKPAKKLSKKQEMMIKKKAIQEKLRERQRENKKDKKKQVQQEPISEQVTSSPAWKNVRAHWSKFFLNVEGKLSSEDGQKKLVTRIKKYLREEENPKLKVKLKKLKKLVLKSDDGALAAFNEFQDFTTKHVKRLKKGGKQQV